MAAATIGSGSGGSTARAAAAGPAATISHGGDGGVSSRSATARRRLTAVESGRVKVQRMTQRSEHDVVVYGATGFVGKLTAALPRETAGRRAGRARRVEARQKLEELKAELGAGRR